MSYRIKTGDISPVDLVKVCLKRIKKLNPILNAFITVINEEEASIQAQIAEKEIKEGNYRSPLHGITFSIKDILFAKGVRCTAGSKILSNYIAGTDATVVKRMKKAGAILIGTNNLNEFASGITGTNPFYGSSKNPWSTSRISGGSSGGSAVAVATGMVPLSVGTDTGGSIRVPSSLCGVVGLKATYNKVSRHGVIPLAPSFDHVGCITRSSWDAAAALDCLSGRGAFDQRLKHKKISSYAKIIEENSSIEKKVCIGIPRTYFFDYLHPEVERLFNKFIKTRLTHAAVYDDIDLYNTEKYYNSWKDIRLAEAAEIHLKWLHTRAQDYSEEVRNMLIEGTKISAVKYLQAVNSIKEIRKEFLFLLNHKIDAIVVPTNIIPAFKFGEEKVAINDKNIILDSREALLRNTIMFNSTGLPAITIPIGLTADGLPVGAQIIGPPFKEDLILSVAYNCEYMDDTPNSKLIPPICR